MTSGQVRRNAGGIMDTQKITRILKQLQRENLVWSARVAYRPNVLKVVWHCQLTAAAYCGAVKRTYEESEGPRPEPMNAAEEDGGIPSFADSYETLNERYQDAQGSAYYARIDAQVEGGADDDSS
jgi:hypothetical protein